LACGCFVPIKPTPSKPLIISFWFISSSWFSSF
jgi:hypothetical protein